MYKIMKHIQEKIPNTFVHSIRIGNNRDEDKKAGFFGNINNQVYYNNEFRSKKSVNNWPVYQN